jgi:hypothetical protein
VITEAPYCSYRSYSSHSSKKGLFPLHLPTCKSPYLTTTLPTNPTIAHKLDGIGGYIGKSSWGGHTDEDVYGISDGEQEAQRLATGQQNDQDDAEIAQLATRLPGQSLEPSGSPILERQPTNSPILEPTSSPILEPAGSPILEREPTQIPIPEWEPNWSPISEREPSEVELGESSTATQLLKQLYSFQGCTDAAPTSAPDI